MKVELQNRFNRLKTSLTQQWADDGIAIPPTDKEVWGQMRAVSIRNQEDAMIDDMQGFVEMYQERIADIDKILESL